MCFQDLNVPFQSSRQNDDRLDKRNVQCCLIRPNKEKFDSNTTKCNNEKWEKVFRNVPCLNKVHPYQY